MESEIQIISIDMSTEDYGDFTAITSVCGSCRTCIDSKVYNPKLNDIPCTVYKKCPICGIEFKGHRFLEEPKN